MSDSRSAINTSIFNVDFTAIPLKLDVYSTDAQAAGYYSFSIKVYYDIQPTVEVTTTFRIELRLCT